MQQDAILAEVKRVVGEIKSNKHDLHYFHSDTFAWNYFRHIEEQIPKFYHKLKEKFTEHCTEEAIVFEGDELDVGVEDRTLRVYYDPCTAKHVPSKNGVVDISEVVKFFGTKNLKKSNYVVSVLHNHHNASKISTVDAKTFLMTPRMFEFYIDSGFGVFFLVKRKELREKEPKEVVTDRTLEQLVLSHKITSEYLAGFHSQRVISDETLTDDEKNKDLNITTSFVWYVTFAVASNLNYLKVDYGRVEKPA
jgi:hypothetical protein